MKKIFPYTLCALVALLMFSCEPLIKPQHHFSVLFDANGGDGDMDAQILAEGVIDHLVESGFKREGYTFVGWNTAPDGSGTSYDDAALFKTDQNITLYAQWEKLLFPLFFEANGGSGNMSAQMIKYDESTALNENTFIRGGYRFTGWNTEADGSGKAYKDKQAIVITQESYLYAQWTMLSSGTENGHSYIDLGLPSGLKWASFNLGAKTPEGSGDYFAWGETEPKKEYSWESYKWSIYSDGAYKMTKYNTDSHYGTVVDNKESLEIEDDAAHVNWQGKWRMPTSVEYAELINYCTWTWASQNGISGFIVKSEVNDNSIFLPAAGWYVKSGCEYISKWGFYWLNNLTPGISPLHAYYWKFYSELYKQPYDHIDYVSRYYGMPIRPVYAEFAIVTFNANGGQGEMPAQQFAIGESQALMSNAFTRAGYTFSGWNTAPDGSGAAYYNHQIISPEQNLTLYAQWEIIPAIVSFDANGGQGTMAPQIFDPTVLQALNANTFTRDGHMFAGWNTAPDGSGTPFNDQAEVMIGGDLTLYAQWYAVSGFENEHAYVDLGLPSGTKWAICNLGATAPEVYGDYFAWGETSPKDNYDWKTYKFRTSGYSYDNVKVNKYNTKSDYGTVDNKTSLEFSDDAARANWGGQWRMPTKVEQHELRNNCTWTWTTQNGVNGYKVTSKTNGNSIFLPAAGYRYGTSVIDVGSKGYYWSSSLHESYPSCAYYLYFRSGLVSYGDVNRYDGYTVRAVISDDAPQATIYTVTFDANGGSGTMAAQTFEAGVSQAIVSNTFTREGYDFIGWNTKADGSGTSYTNKQIITLTQDMTLYAQWKRIKYNLSFDANGGEGTMAAQTFEEGVSQSLAANTFTRSGYTFAGWNTAADGSGTSYTNKQIITLTQDITLYAQWERIKYNLSFNANGGSGAMSAQTFEAGVSQAIAANAFTRSGYTFAGWNTKVDGSGTSYTDGQEITLTQDITLYAQWEQVQVVSGTENGHDYVDLGLPSGRKWATCNVGATTPEGYGDYFAWGEIEPKDNYEWSTYKYCNGSSTTFTKYNTKSNYGTVDNKTTLELSDDAARVNWGGKWRMPTKVEQDELRNNCTWTWTTQNGVNGYKVTSNTNGNSIFLPAAGNRDGASVDNVGSDGGYWSSSLIGVSPESAFKLFFYSGYVNWIGSGRLNGHTVRAVFSDNDKPSTFLTLTFNANGGEGTMAAQAFEEGVSQAIVSNTFTRSGYTFTGWNTNADGSGTFYTNKQSITLTQDVTLYAQWERIKYNLSFDANGGSGTMAAQTFEAGVSQAIKANTFTRSGYTFTGWNTAANGRGTSYTDKQLITLSQDITLYAQWESAGGSGGGSSISGTENGHDYVELGLPSGLKWATCNVGATTPEGYGDYFAWGETEPKSNCDWNTYKYCNGSGTSLTKYNTSSDYGTVDNKTTLDLSDDAARVNWGGKWRMPTKAEQDELRNNCTWTWTTQNGVNGYKVTSNTNGNSIFLPADGYCNGTSVNKVGSGGYYWSSSLHESIPDEAYYLLFSSGSVDWFDTRRHFGFTVRAVCP